MGEFWTPLGAAYIMRHFLDRQHQQRITTEERRIIFALPAFARLDPQLSNAYRLTRDTERLQFPVLGRKCRTPQKNQLPLKSLHQPSHRCRNLPGVYRLQTILHTNPWFCWPRVSTDHPIQPATKAEGPFSSCRPMYH